MGIARFLSLYWFLDIYIMQQRIIWEKYSFSWIFAVSIRNSCMNSWTPFADPCNFQFTFVGFSWNFMNITASWFMCFGYGLWAFFILWWLPWIGKESALLHQRTSYRTYFHCKFLSNFLYSTLQFLFSKLRFIRNNLSIS